MSRPRSSLRICLIASSRFPVREPFAGGLEAHTHALAKELRSRGQRILFGHWAALEGNCKEPGVIALDSGCVWGGKMTLLNVDSGEMHRCACSRPANLKS